MFKAIKNWFSDVKHTIEVQRPETKEEADARMIGEPVTSFLASLAKDRRRYKIERVNTLDEFPKYTCYDWMHNGAGTWKFIDTKTGLELGAYIHERGRVYQVYGLPFDLNHWELKAVYEGFTKRREKAEARRERMRQSAQKRAWIFKAEREKADRLRYAEMFKEG